VKGGASAATCATTATDLGVPFSPVVSPDGLSLYFNGGDVLLAMDRAANGTLTQSSCVKYSGSSASCATTYGQTSMPQDSVVSPDNRNVYMTTGDTLWIFARELPPTCAGASLATPFETQLTAPLSCSDPNGDSITRSIVTAPAGGDLSPVDEAAGSVLYTPRAGFSGNDGFTFQASDGTLASTPASISISVAVRPAPAVSDLTVSNRRFRVGRRPTPVSAARRAPVGTTFRYRLSIGADVTLAIHRLRPGRRVARRCVKPTRANKRRPRCTRRIRVGTLRRTGRQAGLNRTRFSGRIGSRALRPGRYRVTVIATAAGRASAPRRASFSVVRR
jgi:hypothetical protein